MSKPKSERNKEIVKKRLAGKGLRELGRFYNLAPSTIHEIYHRERGKYSKKEQNGH